MFCACNNVLVKKSPKTLKANLDKSFYINFIIHGRLVYSSFTLFFLAHMHTCIVFVQITDINNTVDRLTNETNHSTIPTRHPKVFIRSGNMHTY